MAPTVKENLSSYTCILNRNRKYVSKYCKFTVSWKEFSYKMPLFLLPPLLSGHLREGQWRFLTEEMWRTPSVTCWAAFAPPVRTWAPLSLKSWAEEQPSSASRNSRAKCSPSRTYTCPHTFTQAAWYASYAYDAELKQAKWGQRCDA